MGLQLTVSWALREQLSIGSAVLLLTKTRNGGPANQAQGLGQVHQRKNDRLPITVL